MSDKEYAKGGYIGKDYSSYTLEELLDEGCVYYVSPKMARNFREELDRINEDVVD